MKKLLILTIIIILLSSTHLHAASWQYQYYIRDSGIWRSKNNQLEPFILLGMSDQEAIKIMGKQDNNSPKDGYLLYEGKNVRQYEPSGFCLHTYCNVGYVSATQKNSEIQMIKIYNPLIKTLKNVGIGNTCKQIWDTHGYNYYCPTMNYNYDPTIGNGFSYTIGQNIIIFSVGTALVSGDAVIGSIIVFDSKIIK